MDSVVEESKEKKYGKYEKYEIEQCVRTLADAEEIKKDKEKMGYVAEELKKQKAKLDRVPVKSLDELKDRASKMDEESDDEDY